MFRAWQSPFEIASVVLLPRNDKNVFSYVGGGFIRPGLF